MFACQRGTNVELVKIFIKYGANPMNCDRNRVTAVHMAALSGNAQILSVLATVGASCIGEIGKNSPLPPLHLAAKSGQQL